jgi:hypothetical protein
MPRDKRGYITVREEKHGAAMKKIFEERKGGILFNLE